MAEKKLNKDVELEQAAVEGRDPELEVAEDDSYDNPIWFWGWMVGLVLLFFAFGYIQKATDPDIKAHQAQQQQSATMGQTAQTASPVK